MFKNISLTASYLIALAILIIWSTFAFFTMQDLIKSQEKYGKLINLSGKQRMLSQKISLETHLFLWNNTKIDNLKNLISQMQNDYDFIKTNLPSEKIKNFYFKKNGLDQQIQVFFKKIDDFIETPELVLSENITQYSSNLLETLNNGVILIEEENNAIVEKLKNRELYIYLGTLITLFLEAIIIIFPMIDTHKKFIRKLQKEVDKRIDDIKIFENIFENSKEGMIITDEKTHILNINKAFTEITGFNIEDCLGKKTNILKSGKQDKHFYKNMWDSIHKHGIWQGKIINRRKDGKEIIEFLTIMKLNHKKSINYVSIFSDISEDILNQEMLQYMATHDSLTGLLNRTETHNKIENYIEHSKKNKTLFAIIFIDLDNFKIINDSLGHIIGDKLIIEISRKLSSYIDDYDTVARFGGDEFLIILNDLNHIGEENKIVEQIISLFSKPIKVENHNLKTSASIGIVYYPEKYTQNSSVTNLLRKADIAMYEAKELGKNQVAYYHESLEKKFQSKLLVEQQLRNALSNNELELYLQAKIDLKTGEITSAEALIRWIKDGKTISPAIFIPIAQESDLIIEIDKWVTKKALVLLEELHNSGYEDFKIAINLSGKTFSNLKLLDEILEIIVESNLVSYIEIEITEGLLIKNLEMTAYHISKIKDLGISVSLDDFGTGYSSFSYLHRLAIDSLKIDCSFIANLNSDKKQQVLVESMISFSKKLDMKVIAEGVETFEQLEWLKNNNCDYIQGFLLSKPIPLDNFKTFLRNQINI